MDHKAMKSISLALVWLGFPAVASAVIVAGASGGGNTANNTTREQFESEYGITFPIYDNVLAYSDASGIYLGYNPDTFDVWVLSAKHVTDSSAAITIGNNTYSHQQRVNLTGDLELNRYRRPDNIMPTLPAVSLALTSPGGGTGLLMIGIGQNRLQNAATTSNQNDSTATGNGTTGYTWSGTRIKRWGVNSVEAGSLRSYSLNQAGTVTTTGFATDFDQPANGQWLNSNEAQGSLGDSGGGAFILTPDGWALAGVFTAVGNLSGQNANTSAFGSFTILTDVATYRSEIVAVTGTLIPEPSTATLLLLTALPFFSRRKR